MYRLRCRVFVGMILAAASRLIPHPPNLAPIRAMALCGGACFAHRRAAFVVPLAAMFLSDLAIGLLSVNLPLGLHRLLPFVYGSFALIVCLGFWLGSRRTVVPIAGAALASSVLYVVLTSFGIWAPGSWYPKTWEGLVACYAAAIPFCHHTLVGDAGYTTVPFGGLALADQGLPALREPAFALSS